MATIPPYVAKNTHVDQSQSVKAKKFVWVPVGTGQVTRFSDHEVAIDGQISILGYSGNMNIYLQLTDNNPTAQTGSCILRLNKYEDPDAKYKVDGRALTVYAVLSGHKQNITISPCNDATQTECKLFGGKVNETVHLEPK